MLHQILIERRGEVLRDAGELIRRLRPSPRLDAARDENLSAFLDAVIDGLKRRESLPSDPVPEPKPSGSIRSQPHWEDYEIDELVYEYGSLCTTILRVAHRHGEPLSSEQNQALNQALDENIAADVLTYERKRNEKGRSRAAERLGFVAHELRNALHTAALSFQAIRTGRVPAQGDTGVVLERSHRRLRELVEQLLTQVRLGAGILLRRDRLAAAVLAQESVAFVGADAQEKDILIRVALDPGLEVYGDATLLTSALTNLLQNAVKFSRPGADVWVRGTRGGDGVTRIEVEDGCGGLEPGAKEIIFAPFAQANGDRSGLGLGLSIAREIIAAHGGRLGVQDLPGIGCTFQVDLPGRKSATPQAGG